MFTYFISFRISDQTVNGKTYNERRADLITNARTSGAGFWDGTTSFIAVESALNTSDLAKKISSALSKNHDMLLVFDPSDMSMAHFGVVPELAVISSFFRTVRAV